MPNIANWLAPARAARTADTLAEIADDPSVITVRRTGRAEDLTLTVRILRAGQRASRAVRSEASAQAQSDVTILAPAGSDLRKGDRVRVAADSSVYVITFVMPGQEYRLECDATVEQ